MLMKIGGLARALAIILAIVAGFVALTMMNVPLVLVVLGLSPVSRWPKIGLLCRRYADRSADYRRGSDAYTDDRAQLRPCARNLQMAMAGALATSIAIRLYHLTMDGVTGLTGGPAGTPAAAAR